MPPESTTQHAGPENIARGVLSRGSTILVCQNLSKGYFYLPGGHIEQGESAAQALVREFAEETGLEIQVGSCAAVMEVLFGSSGHEINIVFHVEHAGELPDTIMSQEDDIGFEWIEAAAIVDTDLRPRATKAWLVGGQIADSGAAGLVEFITDHEEG